MGLDIDEAYFSDDKIDDIFLLNNKEYTNTSGNLRKGLYVNNTDSHSDIGYNTCMCLYHTQGSKSDGIYGVKVENVVDIESPGIITVHKFNKIENGKATYTSSTVDLTNETEAKYIFTSVIGGSASNFDHERIKKEISAFAYLAYKSYDTGTYRSSGQSNLELAMDYSWKAIGNYSIRKYAAATEKLSSAFDINYNDMSDNDGSTNPKAPTDEIPDDYVKTAYEETNGVYWRDVAKHQVKDMIEEITLKKLETTDIGIVYDENYAYIGPLMATFTGGTPTITVEGVEAKWARQKTDGSFEINSQNLVSSSEYAFYAVVNKDIITGIETANVRLNLSFTKYKTRLILTKNATNSGQQLMFHAAKQEEDSKEILWDVGITQEITIQKQDSNGNNLNVQGIKFEVYTLDNVKVGDLTTDANGRDEINLKPDTTYKIKETKNPEYGYKNASISGASMTVITADGTVTGEELNVVNGEAQFTVTAGADHVINIRNTPQLGNLTIRKLDENGNPIEGAEFLIWQSRNWGYININGNAQHITTSEGTDIKALYEQGNISGGKGTYVEGTTTHYVTNEQGEIVLKNLEIYHAKNVMYNYVIREMSNPSYGYKGMYMTESDITLYEPETSTLKGSLVDDMYADDGKTDGGIDTELKKARFTIGDDTTVTMVNRPQLGDLTIKKVDENGNPMQGVEFVIWQNKNWGYININDSAQHTTTSEGTDIKALCEEGKISGGGGTLTDTTTRYVTNEQGLIVLKNLEIYHAINEKYEYIIREMSNDNHGYKAMIMTDGDISISEAEGSEIEGSFVEDLYTSDEIVDGGKDTLRKKVGFTIGDDTTVTIKNTAKLGNLVINKKGDDGSSLENVEFTLYQAVNNEYGYIRLIKNSQFVEIINEEIDINDYDVEYVKEDDEDYINKVTRFITNEEGKIVINNLEVYLGIDSEYNPVKYNYWICEEINNAHGYRHMSITEDDVTIDGGEIIELDLEEKEIGFTLNDTATTITLDIINKMSVANLEIQKLDNSETPNPLGNVQFLIERRLSNYEEGETLKEYIVLKNANGGIISNLQGEATINIDNAFEETEYSIDYTTDEEEATTFVTRLEDGKIIINNLEVYASDWDTEKSQYIVYEKYNPNYGYGSAENINVSQTVNELIEGETVTLTFNNKLELRNIKISKVDKDYENIVLPNVEFVIQARTATSDVYSYLALQQKGGLLKEVTGTVTISTNGNTSTDGSEYALEYIKTSNEYSEELKKMITVFKTDENGQIVINNLETYNRDTGEEYIYKLIEIENPNYGYDIYSEEKDITSVSTENDDSEDYVENPQIVAKLSGYVWIENEDPTKYQEYDLLYTNTGDDEKLTDLYKIDENGTIEENKDAKIPVKIMLKDKEGNVIKSKPDEFIYEEQNKEDKTEDAGKYTFNDVEIENLSNYEIVFEYDGLYYTTILPNTEVDNGSKVKENENDRTELNQKFQTVESGDKIIATDGTENGVLYGDIVNRESPLLGFEDSELAKVKAETIIDIKNIFDNLKDNATSPIVGVDNINMGLILREQPGLAIGSNIKNVKVNVVNETYTYDYSEGDRVYINEEYYDYKKDTGEYIAINTNEDNTGNILEDSKEVESINNVRTQNLFESDIAAMYYGKNMSTSVIYQIEINNTSSTLTSVVHEIKNYMDARYTIDQIGLKLNAEGDLDSNYIIYNSDTEWKYEDITLAEGSKQDESMQYKSTVISLGEDGMLIEPMKIQRLYIKYKIDENALKDLINKNAVYNNAAEIIKYSTYYGAETGKADLKKVTVNENGEEVVVIYGDTNIITETQKTLENETTGKRTKEVNEDGTIKMGEIYAGICIGNRPDNIELKLIEDSEYAENEALIFDITQFEKDSTSAQTLILEANGTRKISGKVFEDATTVDSNNEKYGNGKYDSGEAGIKNVMVELFEVMPDGAISNSALYADDQTKIIAQTGEDGTYTLGGHTVTITEAGVDRKIELGILPGRYVIVYTYGSYENDMDGKKTTQTYINGKSDPINIMDYKSTILSTEDGIKLNEVSWPDEEAGTQNEVWFTNSNLLDYSVARDRNLKTVRPEYNMDIEQASVTNAKLRTNGIIMRNKLGQDDSKNTMKATTPIMDINIQFTQEDYIKVVEKSDNGLEYPNLNKELSSINFGICERPDIVINIEKEITEMEIIAQNGASIVPKGKLSSLEYITAANGKNVSAQIESKLLQGAILNLEYTVTVTNESNVDYLCESYYYYGVKDEDYKNTPNAQLIVDYLDTSMKLDETKEQNEIWEKKTANDLETGGYINTAVYNALTSNGEDETYYAYTTDAFKDVQLGTEGSKSEKMYVTKKLSISDDMTEINRVEVIEIAGRRTIKNSIPGNYVPTDSDPTEMYSGTQNTPQDGTEEAAGEEATEETTTANETTIERVYWKEADWDRAQLAIIPPTGTTVDYAMYTIATIAMLIILTAGIIVIKKKVIT